MALTAWKTPNSPMSPQARPRDRAGRIPGDKDKPDLPGGGWQRRRIWMASWRFLSQWHACRVQLNLGPRTLVGTWED